MEEETGTQRLKTGELFVSSTLFRGGLPERGMRQRKVGRIGNGRGKSRTGGGG